MGALIDGLIGVFIILAFFYFVYSKISKKHPEIKEKVDEFNPLKIKDEEGKELNDSEKKEQIWKEHRSMI